MILELWPALMMGFFGSLHCLGMCGGIIGSLSLATEKPKLALVSYNVGRITSYAALGALVGWLGQSFMGFVQVGGVNILRLVAAVLIISMGLYLLGQRGILLWFERGGSVIWRYLQPLSKKLLPVKKNSQALVLGGLWGFLPCGLVYTALGFALTQQSPVSGAAVMLLFGLGTLPGILAMFASAQLLQRFAKQGPVRYISAFLLIGFGVWTAYLALAHHEHGDATNSDSAHQHHHH